MHRTGFCAWILVSGLLLLVPAARSVAQDPVATNPGKFKVLLENERVRVLEFRDKPGDKVVMHSHPDHLVYALEPTQRRSLNADGTTREISMKAGEVTWRPAETHSGENIGTTESHAILIELKAAKAGASGT